MEHILLALLYVHVYIICLYTAYENSFEPGYVTEKAFHGLNAGSVPIYFGDCVLYRTLLPHPKAAIMACDYNDHQSLINYVLYLLSNETAYEEHRQWRQWFDADAAEGVYYYNHMIIVFYV